MTKCSIIGCSNNKQKCPGKHFFNSPRPGERRESWMKPTGKCIASKFLICEDHFDMETDVEFYKMNGAPSLYKSAYPHRNLTSPEMALQAKLDKLNWKCFVPSCENKRLMSDINVVFFAVPEGLSGQFWRAAVFEDKNFTNRTSDSDHEFCCEDHFDITRDLNRKFSTGTYIEYTVKAGTVPSLNLSDSKVGILDEVKSKRLCELNIHPRVILNNRLTYLYGSKFPLLLEKLQTTDPVSFVAVNGKPIEWDRTAEIKIEPMDAGYEYEISSKFVLKTEEPYTDTNPLELEPECKYQSKTESESSVGSEKNNGDPDISTEDLSSTDDESFEPDTSDDDDETSEPESVEDETGSEVESDLDTAERFECHYCKRLVINLDSHVERTHWNFSKNVNRTRCGLCSEIFPRRKDLRAHQHISPQR